MNEIEYLDHAPVEAKWFRLELPYPRVGNMYRGRYAYLKLKYAKTFMASLGLCMNIDFKIESDYYDTEGISILLSSKNKKYASWIVLQWNPEI